MNTAGARAEARCAEHLRRAGLRIVARNWRCRHGELDLVAEDGNVVVFVEVRMRRHGRFGSAAETITHAKRRRLIAAARQYLAGVRAQACRFDVLSIDGEDGAIEWMRDAFGE